MINVRIKIGNGEIYDTYKKYGLIYKESDNIIGAPIKDFDSTSYSGENGTHIDPRTVANSFDYKVTFIVLADNSNLNNANAKINAFNKALYSLTGDGDIRQYKEVTFYNDYKRVKIVGIPQAISEAKKSYRNRTDCVEVEFVIKVEDPDKCDFNLSVTP